MQNVRKKIKKRINEHVLCLKKPTFPGFLEYWGGVGGDVSIFSYFYLRKKQLKWGCKNNILYITATLGTVHRMKKQ